jgi:hypothetical protein
VNAAHRIRIALLLAALAAVRPVAAQPPPSDTNKAARAAQFLQDGKKQLEAGDLEKACGLLAGSDALDPTTAALEALASCHERQGRVATAWKDYRELVRRQEVAHDDRAEASRQRAAALEPRLARLLVRIAQPPPDVEVRCDLEVVPKSVLGADTAGEPVDPGAHEIVVHAAGFVDYRTAVSAKAGASVIVDVPALQPSGPPPAAPSSAPAASAPAASCAPSAAAGAEAPSSLRRSPRLPIGIVLGGAGLIGVGVGAGFGVSAISKNLDSNTVYDTCKAPGASPDACARGRDLRSSAQSAATASTIALTAGGAGVLAGVLILAWPTSKAAPSGTGLRVTPLAGPSVGGAAVLGSF